MHVIYFDSLRMQYALFESPARRLLGRYIVPDTVSLCELRAKLYTTLTLHHAGGVLVWDMGTYTCTVCEKTGKSFERGMFCE